jgi:succinate--hydroxymethylglutarate CoA-transferase
MMVLFSVCVNIQSKEGQQVIRDLAVQCDVLLENYIPGKLSQMGLGYEHLSKVNPRLIYCSISGFGPHGPDAQRAGYDVIVEAEAGMMHITGEKVI